MPRWFRWLGCGCAPKVTESPLPPEPESSSTLAPNPDHVLAAAFMLVVWWSVCVRLAIILTGRRLGPDFEAA